MPNWTNPDASTRALTFLLFEQFSNHVFANALEPFRAANTFLGRPAYRWRIVTLDGAPTRSSAGMTVVPDGPLEDTERGEALILLPSYGYRAHATHRLSRRLRAASKRYRALIGLDGGAWLLAAAGLLDDRRATIHFDEIDRFAESFPAVHAQRERWIDDGDRATAAGALTAFELMLHLIARDHGTALTLRIAGLFAASEGDAPSPFEPRQGDPRLRRALAEMSANMESPLSIPDVARRSGCGRKDLERRFLRAFGTSPRKVYQRMRLNAAQHLVQDTELSISEIATRTGYDSAASFTRAFRETFGRPPRTFRSG